MVAGLAVTRKGKKRCVHEFGNNLKPTSPTESEVCGKGKAVPLQARRDPEGSSKLRFPDFVTMA